MVLPKPSDCTVALPLSAHPLILRKYINATSEKLLSENNKFPLFVMASFSCRFSETITNTLIFKTDTLR